MSLSYENVFSCRAEPLGSRINKFFLLLIINTVTSYVYEDQRPTVVSLLGYEKVFLLWNLKGFIINFTSWYKICPYNSNLYHPRPQSFLFLMTLLLYELFWAVGKSCAIPIKHSVRKHQEPSLSFRVSGKACLERATYGVCETNKAIKEKNHCYSS